MISERRRKLAVNSNLLDLPMSFAHSALGYFKNDSPNFINYKGQSLSGPQQVEAFAQAQSIGTHDQRSWEISIDNCCI